MEVLGKYTCLDRNQVAGNTALPQQACRALQKVVERGICKVFPTCVSHLTESRSQVRPQFQPVSCAKVSAFPGWSHEKACFVCLQLFVCLCQVQAEITGSEGRPSPYPPPPPHIIQEDLWQKGMTHSSDEMAL